MIDLQMTGGLGGVTGTLAMERMIHFQAITPELGQIRELQMIG